MAEKNMKMCAHMADKHTHLCAQAAAMLTRTDMLELAAGLGSLAPVRVLWALREANLPKGVSLTDLSFAANNTMVVPWLDYNVRASG